MVKNSKRKYQSGATLVWVVICLLLVSILSLSMIFVMGRESLMMKRDVDHKYQLILLENESYNIINDIVETSSVGVVGDQQLDLTTFLDEYKSSYDSESEQKYEYKLEYDSTNAPNELTITIHFKDKESTALQVSYKLTLDSTNKTITQYEITKWGETSWK